MDNSENVLQMDNVLEMENKPAPAPTPTPAPVGASKSFTYNLKKMGIKALLPYLNRSERVRNYFLMRVRKTFHKYILEMAKKEKWTEAFLKQRLMTCDSFSEGIKRILPQVNDKTRMKLLENFFYNQTFIRVEKAEAYKQKHGEDPPQFLLLSPTMACNLRCKGCWASEYEVNKGLSGDKMREILSEARNEMGIHFIVLTGGEPTSWPPLWDIVEEHPNTIFMPYTNGQVFGGKNGEKMVQKIAELGNFFPCVSIDGDQKTTDARRGEGVYEKTKKAMELFKKYGIFFGFSATHTRENHDALVRGNFIEEMIERGAKIGWFFHYIPLGDNPDPSLAPTPEQRVERFRRIEGIRKQKLPLVMYDFWMDGPYTNGCVGWGRKYIHMTADGDIEPCAFIHFAKDNIHKKSLTECLNADWLKEARSRQPFNHNLFSPCPYIDNSHELRDIIAKHKIPGTHVGAENCIHGPIHEAVKQNAQEYNDYLQKIGLTSEGTFHP